MSLPAALFSFGWHGLALFLTLAVMGLVVRRAPWARLRDSSQLNLLLGFAVGLMLLWSMKAGVRPGLNLHLLGAMAATLALGPHLALVAMALALGGASINGGIEWQALPINFLLMAVVPVVAASSLHRLVERLLPPHFFIFVFVTGFVGAALTVLLEGVVACGVMVAAGAYSAEFLAAEYLPYFLLLGFSEAWISGGVVTLLVVYRPNWVSAFDDHRYLMNK